MENETNSALNRFSDRVENYLRFRPSYPVELFSFLAESGILKKDAVVADVGSGTGISSEPFLTTGHLVFGIEPNNEMRNAAETFFGAEKKFRSVNGTAENTSLPAESVDLIVAGQAFHWFDRVKAVSEFKRILKPGGCVALMWNDRRTNTTDFLKVYEDFLMMFGTDYANVNHKNIQDKKIFDEFFGEGSYREKWFYNYQDVDFNGLKGRVLSASYMPNEGHRDYDFMISCLKKIFLRYQENGKVRLDYDTKVYYGNL